MLPVPVARLGVRHPHRPVVVAPERLRVRRYPVSVYAVREAGNLVEGPYRAETYPVTVDRRLVLVELDA